MSLYNMLFGKNSMTPLLLAVIGLRENDVERFRDAFVEADGSTISIYTRTGGGNRDDYPNLVMRKRPEWSGSSDDDYDSTYCTDTFAVPTEWVADVVALGDIMQHGMRPEFARHLAKTLRREPTEGDTEAAAHAQEKHTLARTNHVMANGHTFVPYDDSAMRAALEIAEKNGGKLRTAWGILPLQLTVKQNNRPWSNAKAESDRLYTERVKIDYAWEIDAAYWAHCKEAFAGKYPLSMASIEESVADHLDRAKP